jgi:hypothetical protein
VETNHLEAVAETRAHGSRHVETEAFDGRVEDERGGIAAPVEAGEGGAVASFEAPAAVLRQWTPRGAYCSPRVVPSPFSGVNSSKVTTMADAGAARTRVALNEARKRVDRANGTSCALARAPSSPGDLYQP